MKTLRLIRSISITFSPHPPVSLSPILLLFTLSFAQTGTVIDNDTGEPLQNALVSLKSTGDLVLTDADGKFEFPGSAVSSGKLNRAYQQFISFRKNTLVLSVTQANTAIAIQLFTANGRKIADVVKGTFHPGMHAFNLSGFLTSSNLIIARVHRGNEVITFPLIISSSLISTPRLSLCSSVSPMSSVVNSSSETLIVSKYGYTPLYYEITSTDAVTIKLTKPATPPPPPGMKPIPGGSFMMGATPDSRYEQNELPPHTVTLSPFFMDSTEVTQADYALLMGIEPWTEYVVVNPGKKYPGKGNNLPAWFLTWDDAVLYCNARSKRDGLDTVYSYSSLTGTYGSKSVLADVKIEYTKKGYRMPTEAEWEFAARAGTYMEFYWANEEDSTAPLYARYISEGPLPVASLLPNDFGLYDMVGNVFEPVNDFYSGYPNDSVTDPIGPSISSSTERIVRGGGWNADLPSTCRIARRIGLGTSPGNRTGNMSLGARIVISNK